MKCHFAAAVNWIAVGLLGLAVQSANAESWDMAVAYPPGNYQTKIAERFSTEVSKATGGTLTIKVQAGGALGFKGPEMLGAVGDGLVPIGTMLLNQQVGVEPLFGVASLPYLVSGFDEMRTFTDLARPLYDRLAAKHNQKILYIVPWPGQNIFSKIDILRPEDFRQLKIRTVDRNGSNFFRDLGASPAQMPWGEVVPALATGVINSVTTSSSSGVDGHFWEFLSTCSLVNWQSNFDMVTVNLEAWKKLDDAKRQAVEAVAARLEPEFWDAAKAEDGDNLALLSSKGMKVAHPPNDLSAYLITKGKPTWATFVQAAPEAKPLIDKYLAATKK
jgi:TRAP-type transport system periplasmic protein